MTKKWSVENGYRLRKELFAFTENKASDRKKDGYPDLMADMLFKIAVQFWYEWHDANGQWFRTYGVCKLSRLETHHPSIHDFQTTVVQILPLIPELCS